MKFTVLRQQIVGFIEVSGGLLDPRGVGVLSSNHIAKPGVLKEMAAEGVARVCVGFVAGRDPAAAFDEVVFVVKSGRGEIVVPRVNFKTFERVDGGFRPLPDVADDIVKPILEGEAVDRTTRRAMFQIEVARCLA